MEPWEALDVDDSDLPSLLHPCNRQKAQNNQNTTSSSTSSSQLLFQKSQSTPKTLDSQSQKFNPPTDEVSPPSSSSPRLIPGPAGKLQAAMRRRDYNKQMLSPNGGDNLISTQEYLKRAVEDAGKDDEFTRNPWLCAVEFDRLQGIGHGMVIGTPLSSIKNCHSTERIPQVVAIIKSITPNGLGDLMVELKDPTGTIGASIHRKVLTEGEFGRDIAVGAVLILQKVVVFLPSRMARYLNITLRNIVKVISKDCGPPTKQKYYASAVKYAAPSGITEKIFSLVSGRNDGLLDEVRRSVNKRGSAHIDIQMETSSSVSGIGCSNKRSFRNQNAASQVIGKMAVREDIAVENHAQGDDVLVGSVQCSSTEVNMDEVPADQDGENGSKKSTQPLAVSKAALPQWTDEQLEELFDCDDSFL